MMYKSKIQSKTHMAILLNSTLINSRSFLPRYPNPNKHYHQRSKSNHGFVSCRATAAATAATTTRNLYEILSLNPKESEAEEIKKAYRNMALKYHPDMCSISSSISKEESTRIFIQVHEAYKTLSDPVLRENYDNGLLLMGMTSEGFRATATADFDDSSTRNSRWREQLVELKRRSVHRMAQKEGSWACRMRSQNTTKSSN